MPKALRRAAEAAGFGVVAAVVASFFWSGTVRRGVFIGLGAAWVGSSLSAAWLFWAKDVSKAAFWWAFGGGMALRAAVLAVLAAAVWSGPSSDAAAVLVSYALGVALMLLIEYRQLKL